MKSQPDSMIEKIKYIARQGYAWPGGYQLALMTPDGDLICPECIKSDFYNVLHDFQEHNRRCAYGVWCEANIDLDEMFPTLCDECQKVLQPAAKTEKPVYKIYSTKWTVEDIEHGDTDNKRLIGETSDLREALEMFGGPFAVGASSIGPITARTWFTAENVNEGTREFYEEGITESRTFHLPPTITDSSATRVARVIGYKSMYA